MQFGLENVVHLCVRLLFMYFCLRVHEEQLACRLVCPCTFPVNWYNECTIVMDTITLEYWYYFMSWSCQYATDWCNRNLYAEHNQPTRTALMTSNEHFWQLPSNTIKPTAVESAELSVCLLVRGISFSQSGCYFCRAHHSYRLSLQFFHQLNCWDSGWSLHMGAKLKKW